MPTKEGEFYTVERWGATYEFTITQKSGPLGWGRCIRTTIQRGEWPAIECGDRNEYKFRTNGRGYIKIYGYDEDGKNYCIAEKRR